MYYMEVIQMESYTDFNKLFELFETHRSALYCKKGKINNRFNFPKHRGAVYGITKGRVNRKVGLSYKSIKFPMIYEELQRIGKEICLFEFNSIQVNCNLVCPKHIDKSNVGKSLLVSFGNYEGCNIVIGGVEYDAFHRPIIFDGGKIEHWNTPLESGIKYSLVFFKSKYNGTV